MTRIDFDSLNNNNNNLFSNSRRNIKIFIQVPPNCQLVRTNKFTGEYSILGSGMHLNNPIYSYEVIDASVRALDYPKQKARSKEGFELTVDPAVTYSITDVAKFKYKSQNPKELLKIKTQAIVRKLISMYTYEELSNARVDLSNNEFKWIKDEYAEYEQEYGVYIERFFLKSVELPLELQDDYQKTKVQEQENARKIEEAKTNYKVGLTQLQFEKRKAEVEREIRKQDDELHMDIDLRVVAAYTTKLKENGYSQEQIYKMLDGVLERRGIKDIAKKNQIYYFLGSQGYINPQVMPDIQNSQFIDNEEEQNIRGSR